MKNRFIIAAAFILSAVSCMKDRNPQPPMGWTAQDVVDRICGVYALESAQWDGAPLDLDGDGISSPSFMDELLSGTWLGSQTECNLTIVPATRLNTSTEIYAYIYHGDFKDDGNGGYSLERIQLSYKVDAEGSISSYSQQVSVSSHCGGEYFRLDNVQAGFEGDLFVISGDTDYFDLTSKTAVPGRETFRYRCISTKEKRQ